MNLTPRQLFFGILAVSFIVPFSVHAQSPAPEAKKVHEFLTVEELKKYGITLNVAIEDDKVYVEPNNTCFAEFLNLEKVDGFHFKASISKDLDEVCNDAPKKVMPLVFEPGNKPFQAVLDYKTPRCKNYGGECKINSKNIGSEYLTAQAEKKKDSIKLEKAECKKLQSIAKNSIAVCSDCNRKDQENAENEIFENLRDHKERCDELSFHYDVEARREDLSKLIQEFAEELKIKEEETKLAENQKLCEATTLALVDAKLKDLPTAFVNYQNKGKTGEVCEGREGWELTGKKAVISRIANERPSSPEEVTVLLATTKAVKIDGLDAGMVLTKLSKDPQFVSEAQDPAVLAQFQKEFQKVASEKASECALLLESKDSKSDKSCQIAGYLNKNAKEVGPEIARVSNIHNENLARLNQLALQCRYGSASVTAEQCQQGLAGSPQLSFLNLLNPLNSGSVSRIPANRVQDPAATPKAVAVQQQAALASSNGVISYYEQGARSGATLIKQDEGSIFYAPQYESAQRYLGK